MRVRILIIATLFFLPLFGKGQIVINEIMYDPKGADASSGGEWIEIQNIGTGQVDLSTWIFFEADTDHKITPDGSSIVPAGGYAIISRDLTSFKNFFSDFSGLLFKASFSLNDSEPLAMKNGKDDEVGENNKITYTSEWGAKNDGNSLQKISSTWSSYLPTPGLENSSGTNSSAETDSIGESPQVESSTSSDSSSVEIEQKIFASIETSKIAMAGADVYFKGKAYGLEKEPIDNARYLWNFGDGSFKEGQNIMHSFTYPGDYVVFLSVSSGKYSASQRVVVKVIPPQILISQVIYGDKPGIGLLNESNYELNISSWRLRKGNLLFSLPTDTYILPKSEIKLSSAITGIFPDTGERVELLYPNGQLASSFLSEEAKMARGEEGGYSDFSTDPINSTLLENSAFLSNETNEDREETLLVDEPLFEEDTSVENLALASLAPPVKNPSGGLLKWFIFILGFVGVASLLVFSSDKNKEEEEPDEEENEENDDSMEFDMEDLDPEYFEIIEN